MSEYVRCSECNRIMGEWQGDALKLKHGNDETIIIGAVLIIKKCRSCGALKNIGLTKERVLT